MRRRRIPAPTARKSAPDYSLQSLERGIDILYALAEHPALSVEELSRVLRCPKSTTYRSLGILRRKELVDRDPATARYRLGLGILRVERAVLRNLPVRTAALPVVRDLAARSGETVVLTLRRGDFGVAVESIESSEPVRVAPAPGESMPLHCGAPMKAILAFSPEADIRQYLGRKLQRLTPRTICDSQKLKRHLAEIRAKGYAESWEEVYVGAVGVAAPILGFEGSAIASLAVSGPIQRMTPQRVATLAPMLMDAAKDVSRRLQLSR